jgi:hypothetical protein
MIFALVHRAILIVLAVIAVWRLGLVLGGGRALVVWAAIWAIACGMATLLLWTSTTDKVTWKNRLAGYLIPWGGRLNGGMLWPIPVISWLVWMAIGGATVWLLVIDPKGETGNVVMDAAWGGRLKQIGLLIAWIIDGTALLYVLGLPGTAGSWKSSNGRLLLKVSGVILGIIAASLVMYAMGASGLALMVAGLPPLVLGVGYGLFTLLIVSLGRKARWH